MVTGEPVNSQSSNGGCFNIFKLIKDLEPLCTVLPVLPVLPFVLSESPSSARGSEGGYSKNCSLVSVPQPSPGGGIEGPRGLGSQHKVVVKIQSECLCVCTLCFFFACVFNCEVSTL